MGWFFFFLREWFIVENDYTETFHFYYVWNTSAFWNSDNFLKFSFCLKVWWLQYRDGACFPKSVSRTLANVCFYWARTALEKQNF